MSFLSPLYLLGAAGVLVPVLIHLFGRRRPRRLRFPSLRLLRAAQQQRRSPLRLRRLLTLLMRMGAIVLLSLALAGPVTRAALLSWLAPERADRALVLDASASMAARLGRASFFERARQAAQQIAQATPARGRLLLATADLRLHPVGDTPVSPAEAVGLIPSLEMGDAAGSLAGCVVEALTLLHSAWPGAGRVYLVTDLQATSLGPLPRNLTPREGQVLVVDVGAPIESNLAITELTAMERPVLQGRPLRLRAGLRAWGKTSGELIPLTLGVPPLPAVGRSVSPRSGEATFAEFEVTPGQPGLLQGQVQLPADALGFDDQRLFAEHVLEALRVLIVGAETDSRYLAAALDPFPEGDERSIMRVQRIEPEALAQTNLAGFEVVVLADAPELSSGAVKNLAGHVATGAGALLVAGPRSDPSAYNGSVLAALSLTGVKLGAAVELKEGVAIADFETARPPLAAFGSPLAGDLMAPRFTRAREISLSADASARVLASLENGTPALIEAAHGRGRVIVLNSSPGPAWSDLVRRPVYLPLVHRLVYHLSQGRTPRVAPGGPGETIAGLMPVQTGRAQVRAEDARPVALEQDAGTWSFVPERVGTFVVEVGGEEVAAFAVNLDPAESDPTRLTAADLSRRLAPADVVLVKAEDLPAFLRRPAPTRTELSALLALAALLLLALESVYSLEGRRADTGMGEALSATRPHRVRG